MYKMATIEAVSPMNRPIPVVPTSVARARLSSILGEFRKDGADAEPVIFGSHRKPEGVMLSYESYERLLNLLEDMDIAAIVKERLGDGSKPIKGGLDDMARELGFDPDELRSDATSS